MSSTAEILLKAAPVGVGGKIRFARSKPITPTQRRILLLGRNSV